MNGFIRGFIGGSLALIVVYTLVQRGASSRVAEGSSTLVELMKAVFSPGRAGVSDHTHPHTTTTLTPTPPAAGGGGTAKFT